MKLTGKIFISADIKMKTGLHIGGSSSVIDIGGIDLGVIKAAPQNESTGNKNKISHLEGVPFIPGSSIKGKLRTLLAMEVGSKKLQPGRNESPGPDNDEGYPYITEIFGSSYTAEKVRRTQLSVSDAFLDTEHFVNNFNTNEMELPWTEGKWENTINRFTGSAENPRQIERVPAGAVFRLNITYDVYNNQYAENIKHILRAMQLLQDDYLGGSGTRGYGRIKFSNVKILHKSIEKYYSKPSDKKETEELTSRFKSYFPVDQS